MKKSFVELKPGLTSATNLKNERTKILALPEKKTNASKDGGLSKNFLRIISS
jgi:hypothetical protein